jgi:cytochrome P450
MSRQSYTIHRDEVLYPNPETFNSKRWISGDGPVPKPANIGFSLFGTGRRTCLGIHLAGMELRLVAVEIFSECKGVRLAPTATWETTQPGELLIAPVRICRLERRRLT